MLRVGFQEDRSSAICLLREGNLPLLMPHKPQQRPSSQFPALPHAFHFPLISLNQDVMPGPGPGWSWASLRDCIMSALPWRSQPIRGATETFPHIGAFWGGTATAGGGKGQGGSKAQVTLGRSLRTATVLQAPEPRGLGFLQSPLPVSPLSDQLKLHTSLYSTNCCGN